MKRILYIITLLSVSFSMMAKDFELTKEFHEQFPVDKNTVLDISNKYGNITINNTEKNEITIDVIVKVEASKESKAQDVLDDIDIELKKEGNKITALTEIDKNSHWKNIELDISYVINMPDYVNTELYMRYGNVYIESITGLFEGEVRYGNFVANSLIPSGKDYTDNLEMAYCGDVIIKAFDKMSLELAYSDAKLGVGNVIEVEGRYSDIEIVDVELARIETAYGDVKIEKVEKIELEGRYSDIGIGSIGGSLEIETAYGDVNISNLRCGFDKVMIEGRYSDVEMRMEKGCEYQVEFEASYSDIKFPKMYVTDIDNSGNRQEIKGYAGSENASSKICIESGYGDISITEL